MYPSISGKILGTIEKAGIDVKRDEVVLTEIKEQRVGDVSIFSVMLTRKGITWDLGFWKINTVNAKIEAFLPHENSEAETLKWLEGKIRYISANETLLRSQHSSKTNYFEKIASSCNSVELFFMPKNYIHLVISNILLSFDLWKLTEKSSFSQRALRLFDELWKGFSRKRLTNIELERETISRLSKFSAACEKKEEVNEKHVQDAFKFYEAIHHILNEFFSPDRSSWFTNPNQITKGSSILLAFKRWAPFNNLAEKNQTPRRLIILFIKMARLQYAFEKLKVENEDDILRNLGLR